MRLQIQSKMFGSALRTRVLIVIVLLEETFPTELTRLLSANLISVQRILDNWKLKGL